METSKSAVGVVSLSPTKMGDPPRKILRTVTSICLVSDLGMRFGKFRWQKKDYYCFQPFAGKDVKWYYVGPGSPLMYHALKALKEDKDE